MASSALMLWSTALTVLSRIDEKMTLIPVMMAIPTMSAAAVMASSVRASETGRRGSTARTCSRTSGSRRSGSPLVRALLGAAQPDPRLGARIPLRLRELAQASGLTLREAHQALQLLFEQGLLQLLDDCLVAPDLGRLSRSVEQRSP